MLVKESASILLFELITGAILSSATASMQTSSAFYVLDSNSSADISKHL